MKDPTKKLKLVCSFNGKFRRPSPGLTTRYTAGETRIISVDPTTLTFSNLRSFITQLFSITTENFTLKYHIPGSQTGSGHNSHDPNPNPNPNPKLVLLSSDDDVLCMVEEYQKVVSCGDNAFSRLWVLVFSGNYDDPFEKNGGFVGKENLGFKGSLSSLKGNNCDYSKNNNVGRKKVNSDNGCLRKFVLKQQLLLARKRDQIGSVDSKFGVKKPLEELTHGGLSLITAKNDVNNTSVSSDNCGRKFGDCENLGSGDENFGMNKDCNLVEEKNPKIRSSEGSCEGISGSLIDEEILNRLHCNAFSFDVGDQVSRKDFMVKIFDKGYGESRSSCSSRRYERLRDVRDSGVGLNFHKRSRCVGKLGGKDWVRAKSYSVLGILIRGMNMRIYHLNSSSRPMSRPHRLSKVAKKRKLNDSCKAIFRNHVNISDKRSQMYWYGGGEELLTMVDTLIDLSKKHAKYLIPMNVEHGFGYMIDDSSFKLLESGLISSYGMPNGITSWIDLPSNNSSLSSFDFAKVTEMVGLGKSALHSLISILAQLDKSPVNPDDKVDLAKNRTYSNLMDVIVMELAAFSAHLATRGIQTIHLENIEELGLANYGTVYHEKREGSDVAIKKIKPRCFNGDANEENRLVADFWKGDHILGQLHHSNIVVAFYAIIIDGPITKLATLTEYMHNVSLKQVLKRNRTIDRRKLLVIVMEAAFGLEYLHEIKIVHFDHISHKFLVNTRDPHHPVCKIGDLDLFIFKKKTIVHGGVLRGTIPWMAPELHSSITNLVIGKVDVYSFEIIIWEPYADMRSVDIIAGIIEVKLRPEIPSCCESSWRALTKRSSGVNHQI